LDVGVKTPTGGASVDVPGIKVADIDIEKTTPKLDADI